MIGIKENQEAYFNKLFGSSAGVVIIDEKNERKRFNDE